MTAELCHVCGGSMDVNFASCYQCGRNYHLALRVDVDVTDCGDAWVDDEVQALVFGCNVCLGRVSAPTTRRRYARREGGSASAVARGRRRPGPAQAG
jgi:hypothetical protein